jgi:RHS repeat-associated protein
MAQVSMKRGAEVLASMTYTRDNLGRVEKAVETGFPETPEYKYEYDAANRLTKSNGTLFEYDAANNVKKITPTTYTYDKADQIATASSGTFEYNKLGQRIKETPTGETAIPYSFDQAGNLISTSSGGFESTFKYDGSGLLSTETRNASTYPMVWDSSSGLPLLLRKANDYFVYGPGGLPIEQITSGVATYLHHDQLGSTRILTNSSGETVGTYRYGPNGAVWKVTGTKTTQLGFAGQYRMSAQKQLIYLRARTYDPVTAQFLSPDPLAAVSGETYAYAAANPVNLTDPSGLSPSSGDCPCPPCEDDIWDPGAARRQIPELVATSTTQESSGGGVGGYVGGIIVGGVVTAILAPEIVTIAGVYGGAVLAGAIGSAFGYAFDNWVVGNQVPQLADLKRPVGCGAAVEGLGTLFGAASSATGAVGSLGRSLTGEAFEEAFSQACEQLAGMDLFDKSRGQQPAPPILFPRR